MSVFDASGDRRQEEDADTRFKSRDSVLQKLQTALILPPSSSSPDQYDDTNDSTSVSTQVFVSFSSLFRRVQSNHRRSSLSVLLLLLSSPSCPRSFDCDGSSAQSTANATATERGRQGNTNQGTNAHIGRKNKEGDHR